MFIFLNADYRIFVQIPICIYSIQIYETLLFGFLKRSLKSKPRFIKKKFKTWGICILTLVNTCFFLLFVYIVF